MRRYFEDLRAVIECHGGTVEKFAGDAVMAAFGIPVSHEDDALRAVRARPQRCGPRSAETRLLVRDAVLVEPRAAGAQGEVRAGITIA